MTYHPISDILAKPEYLQLRLRSLAASLSCADKELLNLMEQFRKNSDNMFNEAELETLSTKISEAVGIVDLVLFRAIAQLKDINKLVEACSTNEYKGVFIP
jgi:hypothetical protein